jgi:hypothetical protein
VCPLRRQIDHAQAHAVGVDFRTVATAIDHPTERVLRAGLCRRRSFSV